MADGVATTLDQMRELLLELGAARCEPEGEDRDTGGELLLEPAAGDEPGREGPATDAEHAEYWQLGTRRFRLHSEADGAWDLRRQVPGNLVVPWAKLAEHTMALADVRQVLGGQLPPAPG